MTSFFEERESERENGDGGGKSTKLLQFTLHVLLFFFYDRRTNACTRGAVAGCGEKRRTVSEAIYYCQKFAAALVY